jgi:CBS domain-containing protein
VSGAARSVGEIMARNPRTVAPDTPIEDAARVLLEHKIGAVPVVEPGTHDVVGIISYVDLLRALGALIEGD